MDRWGSNQDRVVLFQYDFLTGVVLLFLGGWVVFKTGVAFKPIWDVLDFLRDVLDFLTMLFHPTKDPSIGFDFY